MSKKITIAIDGYSSTGKSTVAKQLAAELGYVYVDTGAMYRAVTLYLMRKMLVSDTHFDEEAILRHLPFINISFVFNEEVGYGEVHLNNENVEKEIRLMEVSQQVSKVAAVPDVRKMLVKIQQEIGKNKAVVMDGRDIGTVVFPDADLKLFMTASTEKRAERRYDELKGRGDEVKYEDVLANVKERDYLDTTREDSPLVKAEDAIEIDNSDMNLEEQFEKVLKLAKDKIEE
ncbi:(d)CMP kinase [Salegentibacter mishustinae]|jgi:cytidylate kinase|uniref:Cytidylate kinase n=1 Tax=Salegentibacter mishustinae TaxID=270918 RepID=A0A0Q9ZNS9_9FLAO|nr:(d)CMP kinase [Salegentibacter mishustinae]KRG30184.1 cytidylate kinase [Salegentibacter mishustinae]PNW19434.1 cytidylate kinase [Salegentibacter mishustinae]PZX62119.1 cytidylate kinase [Salegentibacter mishustinae]GGW94341.1 cytidylate kinase [Salegentibacter mishustinae]|tara:strand:+ start:123 stop:815 length:693 start_codon:yes stop_codon:yes gene_type:complete